MAKGSKKKLSAASKQYYNSYNGEKQREKRIKRHLKKHPNDGQAANAKPVYRRRKPLNKGGWLDRPMSRNIYLGKLPGKDDDPVSILNNMSRVDQFQMAKFAKMVKAMHNRFEYEKNDKSKPSLGYAG